MKLPRHDKGNSGFTVLELIVAIGVAMLVMGIALPTFLSWLPMLRLSSAARQVAADLQVARIKAIAQNASTTVTFNTTNSTYTYGSDSRSLPDLYPGITISSAPTNPVFTPRGTTSNTGTVAVTLSNGSSQKLVCVKTVGRVNIADSTCT